MILTLLRHAEVVEEYQGKYNGHIDIALSCNGVKQAKKLALELQGEVYDAIYCSNLLRAKQTLELLNIKNTQIIYSEKLREKSWGIHEGKSFEEIEKSGIKYENFEQWIYALDGENIDEFIKKIKVYFEEIIFTSNAKNILIITHSGVIKSLLKIFLNTSLREAFSQNLEYASFIKLEKINSKFRIL
jgi:alpha-ribazole phosphatase